ncbi:MAG TPA: HAD family hydrolase [Thermoanaerobaculia bacterium]|nr:HAD family hydrolase [Thermoanaerobaculia bacterium]
MLKAVCFDLWETLITDTPEISDAQKRFRLTRTDEILRARGHVREAEQLERGFHTSWQRLHELYWSADRDIPCRTQVEVFLQEIGVDPSHLDAATLDEIEDAYANAAVRHLPAVVPGAREVLAGIARRGYHIGMISNTGRTPGYALREILTRLDLAPKIDAMVFSNEHGFCKPVPSIFETLRDALAVRFDEMMFVGDNLYVDVYGAKRCGIRAVHFIPQTRGTAVAPHVQVEVEPDATVTRLEQLLTLIDEIRDSRFEIR